MITKSGNRMDVRRSVASAGPADPRAPARAAIDLVMCARQPAMGVTRASGRACQTGACDHDH